MGKKKGKIEKKKKKTAKRKTRKNKYLRLIGFFSPAKKKFKLKIDVYIQ